MEDTSFVKVGGTRVMDQKLKGGIGAEEGEKGIVVNEKGLGLGSSR